jgi:hypothetical protein
MSFVYEAAVYQQFILSTAPGIEVEDWKYLSRSEI